MSRSSSDYVKMSRIRQFIGRWALRLIMAVALLFRIPGLYSRPLWYDEAFAVLFSRQGPEAMLLGTLTTQAGIAADVHPLGYYSLLFGWGRLFGTGAVSVRTLSLFLGLASILLAYYLAMELFDKRVALAASATLALAPFPVHYAQEVRMYALLTVLVLAASLMLMKAFHEAGHIGNWIGFSLCAAAAQYTHNLAFLYLVPMSMTAIFTRERKLVLRTFLAGGGAIVLYLPWLLHLPEQLARLQWSYWIRRPGLQEVLQIFLHYTGSLPSPAWSLPALLFISLSLLILACIETYRSIRRRVKKTRQVSWMFFMAFMPAVLMLVISLWQPIFLLRALLPAAMFFTIGLVWCLLRRRLPALVRVIAWSMLAVGYAIGLFGWYTFKGFPYAPFSEIAFYLRENLQPGDVILHSNKITALPTIYVDPGLEQFYLADPPGSASDTLAPATQETLGFIALPEVDALDLGGGDIWLIMFAQEEEEYRAVSFAAHPARMALEETFTLDGEAAFESVVVFHYSMKGFDE